MREEVSYRDDAVTENKTNPMCNYRLGKIKGRQDGGGGETRWRGKTRWRGEDVRVAGGRHKTVFGTIASPVYK